MVKVGSKKGLERSTHLSSPNALNVFICSVPCDTVGIATTKRQAKIGSKQVHKAVEQDTVMVKKIGEQ
jgi:hypothetical protein